MKLGKAFLTVALLAFASGAGAQATKHVVMFGGTVGFAYEPNDIMVSVGDTIEWQGTFSMHPLRSATPPFLFPAEAAPISVDTGTVFQYVVTASGLHGYYCQFHVVSDSMAGAFTAIGSSVTESKLAGVELFQNVPNPAFGSTKISFDLAKPTTLTL